MFSRLTTLELLHFDHNPIETIADNTFVDCENLSELSLSHCRLKAIRPSMLTGLKWMSNLRLDHNLISSFQIKRDDRQYSVNGSTPVELHFLKRLELQGNQLTKLDLGDFRDLEYLHHVDLSANKIDQVNGQMIAGRHTDIVVVNMSNNQLVKAPDGSFSSRVKLNLRGNPIRTFGESSL